MVMVDANVILRYILNNDEILSEKAEKIIHNNQVFVTIEVIAEVVYVLQKVYLVDKSDIKEAVTELLLEVESKDKDIIICAVDVYANHNLDFVDCVLYSYKKINGYEIKTFDKKLNKLLESI